MRAYELLRGYAGINQELSLLTALRARSSIGGGSNAAQVRAFWTNRIGVTQRKSRDPELGHLPGSLKRKDCFEVDTP